MNEQLETPKNCIAVSHARRFGKSHAAGMIDAYYSLGCNSTKLFENTNIAKYADFKKYMNKYNVIHLDISSFWDFYKENLVEKIMEYVYKDFRKDFVSVLLLSKNGKYGKFQGYKLSLDNFLEKFKTYAFEIVDELYGYNMVEYSGFLSTPDCEDFMELSLWIYHFGDIVYETEEEI